LFLVYSQSFENDNVIVAKSAIQSVELIFNQTNGWGNCFSQVVGLAVNITSEDDLYRKDEQDTNVLWVNGPNRQFERTARALKDEGIDLFYLMEMDSVPISEYWLDTLVEAIQTQSIDFSILGR
jgi:GT2 family glycosyltransferase